MGNQHVPLTINEDGLVTSVGNQQSEEIYETCVLCGEKTDVKITTHIDYRYGYVEGMGQLCKSCYNGEKNEEILIIPKKIINDTPNDMDLGSKIRYLNSNTQKNHF